jgi:hypothetical protein
MTLHHLLVAASRTTWPAVAFSSLVASPLLGGDGSFDSPWLNGEVTATTLDSGTMEATSFNLINSPEGTFLNGMVVRVGLLSSRNILTVDSGAYVDSTSCTVGFGSKDDPSAGERNSVMIQGKGAGDIATRWDCDGGFTVGYYGSRNLLRVSSGAAISGTSLYVGQSAGTEANEFQIANKGSTASFSGNIAVGSFGADNAMTVVDGAKVTCQSISFGGTEGPGYGDFGNCTLVARGTLSVWGTGSTLNVVGGTKLSVGDDSGQFSAIGDTTQNSGNVVSAANPATEIRFLDNLLLGGVDDHGNIGTGNRLEISDGALILVGNSSDDSLTLRAGNFIRLHGGFLALYGDKRSAVASAIAAGNFQIYIEGTWGTAGAESLHVAYFDNTSPTANGEGLTETGHEGLSGYTVVSDAAMPLVWANAVASSGGWYSSYWYGAFYTVPASFDGWIWHAAHGWQWVYDNGDGSVVLWDCASGTWCYVNRSWYPALYNYADGKWYYYLRGSAPDRVFWNWESGGEVVENPGE